MKQNTSMQTADVKRTQKLIIRIKSAILHKVFVNFMQNCPFDSNNKLMYKQILYAMNRTTSSSCKKLANHLANMCCTELNIDRIVLNEALSLLVNHTTMTVQKPEVSQPFIDRCTRISKSKIIESDLIY